MINSGRYEEAGLHFLKGPITIMGPGTIAPGLMKRRYAEAAMFLRGYDIDLPELSVYMANPYRVYEDTVHLYFPVP